MHITVALICTRDGHFWQFLILIMDRFKKRLIEYLINLKTYENKKFKYDMDTWLDVTTHDNPNNA